MNPKTAAKWIEAHEHCQKTRAPAVITKYVEGKYKAALRVLLDTKREPKIRTKRITKFKTPQKEKKDIRKELEALCKAIVFTRDCGSPEAREGVCITCKKWRVLQWGHFIPQQKSKWLQYDPRATGGQCAGCNGPGGRGMPLEYAEAIDKRDGPGSAKALRDEAELYKSWRPTKAALKDKLRELQTKWLPLYPEAAPRPQAPEPPATGTNQERTP